MYKVSRRSTRIFIVSREQRGAGTMAVTRSFRGNFYRGPCKRIPPRAAVYRAIPRPPTDSFKFAGASCSSSFRLSSYPLNIAEEHIARRAIFHASRWRPAKRNETPPRDRATAAPSPFIAFLPLLLPSPPRARTLALSRSLRRRGERVARPKLS